jgi:hypothetical protein
MFYQIGCSGESLGFDNRFLAENDDEKDCSKVKAMLKVVGRGSVRTGRRASSAGYA